MRKKINIIMIMIFCLALVLSGCQQNNNTKVDDNTKVEVNKIDNENKEVGKKEELKKIKIILDWTPNTNHTGLYCAKELGLFEEAGFHVDIMQPPEGSTTQLVGAGGGEFGISFQDTLAKNFTSNTPLPVTAVAAILQHNTSGIISKKETGIDRPKNMNGKKYSTWDDPVELAILKKMVEDDGGDFSTVELVPYGTDVITALNTDSDSAWVFYAWDGIATEIKGVDTNFLAFKDYIKESDYYTPVLIANNDWLKDNPEDAKAIVKAISDGYLYAIKNPKEAADFLIKNAPESDKELVYASQEWISKQYKDDNVKFGYIDPLRWNAFYKWLYDNKLIPSEIEENFGFSNDYLPE